MKFFTLSSVLTALLIVLSVAALPALPLDARAPSEEVPKRLDKPGSQIFWRADLVQQKYPSDHHPVKYSVKPTDFSSVGALYVFDVSICRCNLFSLTQANKVPRDGNHVWNRLGEASWIYAAPNIYHQAQV